MVNGENSPFTILELSRHFTINIAQVWFTQDNYFLFSAGEVLSFAS
jgi:hypothetical protein